MIVLYPTPVHGLMLRYIYIYIYIFLMMWSPLSDCKLIRSIMIEERATIGEGDVQFSKLQACNNFCMPEHRLSFKY